MTDESFLLVSLKESKSKKLAQVISNETCRKILDLLSKKDASESEIAKELNVPISTVHYNLKHLVDSDLVQADEFHYSEKGKEVDHYRLSNKFIIIAPKATDKLKEKLKRFLPVMAIGAVTAGIIQVVSSNSDSGRLFSNTLIQKTAMMAESGMADDAQDMAVAAAPRMPEVMSVSEPNIALWFLFGAIFSILIYLLWDWILKNKEK